MKTLHLEVMRGYVLIEALQVYYLPPASVLHVVWDQEKA